MKSNLKLARRPAAAHAGAHRTCRKDRRPRRSAATCRPPSRPQSSQQRKAVSAAIDAVDAGNRRYREGQSQRGDAT